MATKITKLEKQIKSIDMLGDQEVGYTLASPPKAPYTAGIQVLERLNTEAEEPVLVNKILDGVFFTESVVALNRAIKELFGTMMTGESYSNPLTGRPLPEGQTLEIETSYGRKALFNVGVFILPDTEGVFSIGPTPADGRPCVKIQGKVRRKHLPRLEALVDHAMELARKDSIYRGQAVSLRWDDNGSLWVPEFVDLTNAPSLQDLVFPNHIQQTIDMLVWDLEHPDLVREDGDSLYRKVLAHGDYGCGKTMLVLALAKHAVSMGRTFIMCSDASKIGDGIRFGRDYPGCEIACEDVDTAFQAERSVDFNATINELDGLVGKDADMLLLFTTNHYERFNEASKRHGRIDVTLHLRSAEDADTAGRLVEKLTILDADVDTLAVGALMVGWKMASIREVIHRAKGHNRAVTGKANQPLTQQALEQAIAGVRDEMEARNRKPERTPTDVEVLAKGIVDAAKVRANGTSHPSKVAVV